MVESETHLTCPLCHQKNPANAHYCQQCGAPLNVSTTVVVSEEISTGPTLSSAPAGVSSRHWVDEHTVGLHVTGYPQPIMVRAAKNIVLGRAVTGEVPPTVDLSDFHAHLLGVSRKHAVIRASEEGFAVEDLGSQNGTWLNEQRLSPHVPRTLSHGDQLRLGQLILFVYLPRRRQTTGALPDSPPSTDAPPASAPPAGSPPTEKPPTGTSPTDAPSASASPADSPTTDSPLTGSLLADAPSAGSALTNALPPDAPIPGVTPADTQPTKPENGPQTSGAPPKNPPAS